MKIHGLTCSLLLTILFTGSAIAQVELPDALQGNPLEDKMIGKTPANPFAPIHTFGMEGTIQDGVTGAQFQPTAHMRVVDGYIGQAIHFDGEAYAGVPIDLHPTTMPKMTVAMMVKADPIPEDPDELASVDASGYIFTDGDSYIILNNQKKTSAFLSAYSAEALVYDSSTFQVPHDQWHMIAMSRSVEERTNADGMMTDHTILKFYVNGRIQEHVAEWEEPPGKPPVFTLGAISPGQNNKLRGAIDQLAVYDYPLRKEDLDKLRDFWRQTAGNEYFFNQPSTARAIEAPQEPGAPSELESGNSAVEELTENLTLNYESPEKSIGRPGDADGSSGSRDQVSPHAGVSSIDVRDQAFTQPISPADETGELINSKEGQAMLQSADWRVEGMVENSASKTELYPGDEVTVKIRVSKDDPANKIPDVVLSIDGQQNLPFRVMTSEKIPTQTRDIPVTLTIPADLRFRGSSTQATHTVEARILSTDESQLLDADPRNHARLIALDVSRPTATLDDGDEQSPTGPAALADWSGDPGSCRSTADFMTDAWQYMDEVVAVVCTGVVVYEAPETLSKGLGKTYRRCASDARKAQKGVEKAVSLFNDLAGDSWAHLGPRELKFNNRLDGQLIYPGDRKYISVVPARTAELKLNLKELAGKAQTEVIVCRKGEKGPVQRLNKRIVFNYNKRSSDKLQDETFLIGGVQDKFISILLETDYNENLAITNVVPRFGYRLRADEK